MKTKYISWRGYMICVEYTHNGLVLSTIGSHLIRQLYIGYTQKEALAEFKKYIKEKDNDYHN